MPANRIEINPEVMLGKPVVRGTYIPIELIIRKLSEGATAVDLLDATSKTPTFSKSSSSAAQTMYVINNRA